MVTLSAFSNCKITIPYLASSPSGQEIKGETAYLEQKVFVKGGASHRKGEESFDPISKPSLQTVLSRDVQPELGSEYAVGGWSPQYPKQGRQQQRRSRDGGDRGKDRKKEEGVARPYDSSTPSSLLPQSSTASGSTETQFMKEFLEMARESKMQIPERLQKLLPDGTKDAIRDQQKRLNRHRNVVNKIDSKKKALELDKERWSSWLQEMKEQIVKQRGNFEENQKKLQKELEALEEEEKKIRSQDSKEDEEEDMEEPNAEQMVDTFMDELKEEDPKAPMHRERERLVPGSAELQDALQEMQQKMESRYQEKLKEQQKMWEEKWTKLQIANVVELSDGEGTAPTTRGETTESTRRRATVAPFWGREGEEFSCLVTVWQDQPDGAHGRGGEERCRDEGDSEEKRKARFGLKVCEENKCWNRKLDGVVLHSLRPGAQQSLLLRSWKHNPFLLLYDRLLVFLALILGDLILFGIIVAFMIVCHRERKHQGVRVGGHLHFRKEKSERISRLGFGRPLFFLYLIMFPQVTLANSHGFGRHEDVEVQEGEDFSMMARSELAWTPPDLPSQHLGMMGASSDASIDGEGEGNPRSLSGGNGEPSETADRFYQLAFIFTLTPSTHTCRLDWANYWVMHQQIADTIGEGRDNLIAVFNVQVLPEDLEALETPAIIPVRASDFAHGSAFVYILIDVEAHEDQNNEAVLTKRFASSFPAHRTRHQALVSLGVDELCRLHDDRCLLWHDGQPWKLGDTTLHRIKNGAYIRCALPPPSRRM